MSLRIFSRTRPTAAWRISIWTTIAFAAASAVAFVIVFVLVSRNLRARSDIWLRGEAATLADVAANTPRDILNDRMMQRVAELALHEVPQADNGTRASVFFLKSEPGQPPLWVGPSLREPFLDAIETARLLPEAPQSIAIPGYGQPFRVVYQASGKSSGIYLGYSDVAGKQMLGHLGKRLLFIWCGMVALGFLISSARTYLLLARVERITETVAGIDSNDLSTRVPVGRHGDEISRLARTFNHMLDRIEASVQELRAVTDAIAHDLKSPVTSIRGSLEVALSSPDGGTWRDSVGEAIEGLDRLSQVLNTALDCAEADAGALQLHKEPLEAASWLRQLAELYLPAMAEHSHTLQYDLDDGISIEADPALLTRVVVNLLDNEVSHLPRGCGIRLTLRTDGTMARLSIEDDGPGFPPEVRERALERFVKGQHSTGHGLGLAFVNAVIQAHGGEVRISDRAGGGALIEATLPLAKVSSEHGRVA